MGKVIRTSERPIPGIKIKEPVLPPQPGEVLIRYEVEAAGGCQLNLLGWVCFGALCLTAFPFSWLPFTCSECKRKYQRPVYGYPMYSMNFLADAADAAKPAAQGATAPPTILCMDASLEQQSLPQHDQQDEEEQQQQQRRHTGEGYQQCPPQQHQLPRSRSGTPSPQPSSIFVPPSLVPACGFTPEFPFPSRHSPVPMLLQPGSPLPSPKPPLALMGAQGPAPSNPGPGAGLPVMGGVHIGMV